MREAIDPRNAPQPEPQVPDPAQIREQLARILRSPAFQQASRSRDFLLYVVEQTLAGQGERLKGYTIALEVFGRPADFDAQADPLVRVEAGRLRQRLAEYYHDYAPDDPVVIALPRGSYAAEFRYSKQFLRDSTEGSSADPAPPPTDPAPPATDPVPRAATRRGNAVRFCAVIVLLFAAGSIIVVQNWREWLPAVARDSAAPAGSGPARDTRPRIAVRQFDDLGTEPELEEFAATLTEELLLRLGRFPHFVATLPPSQSADSAGEADADYVFSGTVRSMAAMVRVSARLTASRSGEQLWSASYDETFASSERSSLHERLARRIAAETLPYGPIFEAEFRRVANTAPENLQSFDCTLKYYRYRALLSPEFFAEADACFDQILARGAAPADAWAGRALLDIDLFGFSMGRVAPGSEPLDDAHHAITMALGIQENNFLANLALARLQFFTAAAEFDTTAERLLAEYPDSPTANGVLGALLALRGDSARGLELVDRAAELSPQPPLLYYFAHGVDRLRAGRPEEALAFASRLDAPDWYVGHLLVAAAASLAGREYEAANAKAEFLRLYPEVLSDAPQLLLRWRVDPALRAAWLRGLGIAEPSQVG